ncbi:MAG: winged helix-turn-helix transcriptional regulator [Oscillospiraceae bacterium]|nr:winged helix-turn-helix transcriptional regulator [Oscillospiraceae bacterium]
MSARDDAQELISKICSCRPHGFLGKIDESRRGIGFVLVYLEESDHEVIAGELSRELNVSTARIAALLKSMEKNGLILRERSVSDARHTVVKITQAGIDYVEKLKEQILSEMEFLVEKVGKEELEEFIRISQKIRKALEE